METISHRTGVSRQTLYRRWPHKWALILDAFAEHADKLPALPDTGHLRGDLTELLEYTITTLNGICGATNRVLVTEGLQDDTVMAELREGHFARRRAQIESLVARAQERGETVSLELDVFIGLLLGPLWHRLIFGHAPLTRSLAPGFVRSVSTFLHQERSREQS